jgi:hypothetical protein
MTSEKSAACVIRTRESKEIDAWKQRSYEVITSALGLLSIRIEAMKRHSLRLFGQAVSILDSTSKTANG